LTVNPVRVEENPRFCGPISVTTVRSSIRYFAVAAPAAAAFRTPTAKKTPTTI
jgi:hypothetical protein